MEHSLSLHANSWKLQEAYGLSQLGRSVKECSRVCGVSGANFRDRMKYMDIYIYIYICIVKVKSNVYLLTHGRL